MGKAGAAGTGARFLFQESKVSWWQDVTASDSPKALPFAAAWPHKHVTRWVSSSKGSDGALIPGPTEIRLRQMGDKSSWANTKAHLNLRGGLRERV